MLRFCVNVLLLVFSLVVISFAQPPTFHKYTVASHGVPAAQADINGDGLLDMVSPGPSPTFSKNGFYVTLSNPNGSYQAPVFYTSPYPGNENVVTLGDFNNDGLVDVAEIEGSKAYYIYLNKGDGTFLPSWNFATSNLNSGAITSADFNHDGRLDLVLTSQDANSNSHLQLLLGHGDGTFAAPVDIGSDSGQLLVGDFDADGNADLAVTIAPCSRDVGCYTDISTYYSDGKGSFSAPKKIHYDADYHFMLSKDVNRDGKSDLIGSSGEAVNQPVVRILFGSSGRSFSSQDVALDAGQLPGFLPVTAADVNGDGIDDLALDEFGSGQWTVVVKLGNPDGSYSPEQTVYAGTHSLITLAAGRYNRDTRPDLMTDYTFDSNFTTRLVFLRNATVSSTFPRCPAPLSARGIAICGLADGSVVSSPVQFHIGSIFTSPLRKTELWIDGQKRLESFNSYSTFSFLDGSLTLSPGPHKAGIYTAGFDNLLQHATIQFTVK